MLQSSTLLAYMNFESIEGGASSSALRHSEAHHTRTGIAVPQEYSAIGFATISEQWTATGHTALPTDWHGMSDTSIPLKCCNTKYGGPRPLEPPKKVSHADHPSMWLSDLHMAAHCTLFCVAPLCLYGLPEATTGLPSPFLVRQLPRSTAPSSCVV